jgi:hypothetical protein
MGGLRAADVDIGYHPEGYRIDKTASAMNRYTQWDISSEGEWQDPRPVCFSSLPESGWVRSDGFDWERAVDT